MKFLSLITITTILWGLSSCDRSMAQMSIRTPLLSLNPTALPSTCMPGDLRVDNTASGALQLCGPGGGWAAFSAVAGGGTGANSFPIYSVLLGNNSGTIQTTGPATSGYVLTSNGLSAFPSYSLVDLTASVSGALPIANGGTGQKTASTAFNALSPITAIGDIILGNGTNSATRLGIGSSGQVLTVSGGTASWQPVTATNYSGVLPIVNGGTNSSAALNNNRVMISSGSQIVEAPAMVSGGIVYTNASGIPITDAPDLYYDDVNKRLSINNSGAAATAILDVHTTNLSVATIQGEYVGAQAANGGGVIQATQDDGTPILAGSRLGSEQYAGSQDNAHTQYLGAAINALATENWSSTSGGTQLKFNVTANGAHSRTTALTLNPDSSATFNSGVTAVQFNGPVSGTATGISGVLPIANGGTGQATASAAFNALSPIIALGDIILGNGTNSATRLPIGASGNVLTVSGATAAWAPGGGGSVTSVTASVPLASTGGTTPNISISGAIGIANGGTNNTTFPTSGAIYYDGSKLVGDATDFITYDGAGHTGIAGPSSGSYALQVSGAVNVSGALAVQGSTGTSGYYLQSNGASAPSWTSPTAALSNYFTGYIGLSAGNYWTTTSATFGAMSITGGTTTLTTLFSNGLTVTAAASNLPGITFTPSATTSVYVITAEFPSYVATANGYAFRLFDGTNAITFGGHNSAVVGSHTTQISGIYSPGTASAVTITLQGAVAGGASLQAGFSGANDYNGKGVTWTVLQIK